MPITEKSIWLSHTGPTFDALTGDLETEIAIIGGGITGVSAAYLLKEKGADFALLERGSVAGGSTGHSMGALVPGIEQEDIWQSIAKYGRARTELVWRATGEAISQIRDLSTRLGIECDFVPGPAFDVVDRPSNLKFLEREHAAAEDCGVETSILDAKQIRERLAVGDTVVGALKYEKCAQMDPAAFVHGLAKEIHKSTGSIFERTNVDKIKSEQGGFMLETDSGTVRARKVIVATESYTGQLGVLKNRIVALRENALATERLDDDSMKALGMKNALVWNMARDYYFMRTTTDGRVMIDGGGTLSSSQSDAPNPKRIASTYSVLVKLFPSLRGREIEFAWSGRMAVPLRPVPVVNRIIRMLAGVIEVRPSMPLVEQAGSRVISMPFLGACSGNPDMLCSAGYIGHGLPLGFLGGRVMAEMSLGEVTETTDALLRAYSGHG